MLSNSLSLFIFIWQTELLQFIWFDWCKQCPHFISFHLHCNLHFTASTSLNLWFLLLLLLLDNQIINYRLRSFIHIELLAIPCLQSPGIKDRTWEENLKTLLHGKNRVGLSEITRLLSPEFTYSRIKSTNAPTAAPTAIADQKHHDLNKSKKTKGKTLKNK